MGYDYNDFLTDAKKLTSKYAFVDFYSIGESVMEKKIYCLKIGTGKNKIFINGAHHGLEYLTSAFIMRFLEKYSYAFSTGSDFFGVSADTLFKNTSLFAVPMVNPDGVDIAIHGMDITNPYHRKLISMVGIHSFNKVWQANANGVDINHNYNANWQTVEKYPSPSKYSGPYSESEPETKAITDFVRSENFDILIAFHSQGGEIYYDFDGKMSADSSELAKKFASVSGYVPAKTSGSASFGGCKDWFIEEFGKAGFTIEIGHGKNPLPLDMLPDIFEENARIIISAMTYNKGDVKRGCKK